MYILQTYAAIVILVYMEDFSWFFVAGLLTFRDYFPSSQPDGESLKSDARTSVLST